MSKEILIIKLEKFCIFMMIITLPIINLPKRFTVPAFGSNLSLYFLLFLIFIVAFQLIIGEEKINKKFKNFILIYMLWIILTSIHGIYAYPYYHLVSLSGSSLIIKISTFFHISQDNNTYKVLFLFLKSLLEGFKYFILPWLGSYAIYHALKKEKYPFAFIRKAFVTLAICLGIYAIPEILIFKLNLIEAIKILEITNPYIYDVKSYLGWYPPIIWTGQQLRSYCIEPSILGAISGAIIPFLWSLIIDYKNINSIALYIYYFMLPIMSKSRTAIVVLTVVCSQILLYIKSIKNYKRFLLICIFSTLIGIGLGISNWINPFSSITKDNKNDRQVSETVDNYIKNNVDTVIDPNARSNGSRLINIKSHFNVLIKAPVMGTGMFLKDMYVKENLVSGAMNNIEIKAITEGIEAEGIFKYSYGNVNDYIFIGTSIGLIGLLIQFFPVLWLFVQFAKKLGFRDQKIVTIIITITASLTTMMTGTSGLGLYILVALGYVLVSNYTCRGN